MVIKAKEVHKLFVEEAARNLAALEKAAPGTQEYNRIIHAVNYFLFTPKRVGNIMDCAAKRTAKQQSFIISNKGAFILGVGIFAGAVYIGNSVYHGLHDAPNVTVEENNDRDG